MKKTAQIILIFITVALSVLHNYVSKTMHRWTSMNYSFIPEYIVTTVFIIIMALLLGLSVFKFSFSDKAAKTATAIIIILGLAAGFTLLIPNGMPYMTVFVSTVYVVALLFRRKTDS
ncbi:MAG: hypothetical protein IKS19_07310 [Clostridia bacterium]|nr:hypothetical protein [Clostridia bacterium]